MVCKSCDSTSHFAPDLSDFKTPTRRSSGSSTLDPTDIVSIEHDIPSEDSCGPTIKTEISTSDDEYEIETRIKSEACDETPTSNDASCVKLEHDIDIKHEPIAYEDDSCFTSFNEQTESLKNIFCGVCRTSFDSRTALTEHMTVHSNERMFICYICDRVFKQKGNLKQHILTHTNARPYKCDVCDKGFNQEGNLIIHKR